VWHHAHSESRVRFGVRDKHSGRTDTALDILIHHGSLAARVVAPSSSANPDFLLARLLRPEWQTQPAWPSVPSYAHELRFTFASSFLASVFSTTRCEETPTLTRDTVSISRSELSKHADRLTWHPSRQYPREWRSCSRCAHGQFDATSTTTAGQRGS
jgi:hypothetical protein